MSETNTVKDKNSVVAICDSREQAVKDLQKVGFDMKKLSIIGLRLFGGW